MFKFFSRLVDSTDKHIEAHLFLMCAATFALIGLAVYHVVCLRQPFNPVDFGEGVGWTLGGGGAAAVGQGMQRKSDGGAE